MNPGSSMRPEGGRSLGECGCVCGCERAFGPDDEAHDVQSDARPWRHVVCRACACHIAIEAVADAASEYLAWLAWKEEAR